ncbi:MAG: glycosyltransferase [Bacteroidia bacterium]|nr:glycosyltransferase [Bacteroidia bacterium]
MKVVHLNTQSYGGAAAAARRLHVALRKHHVDSTLVTRYGTHAGNIPNHVYLQSGGARYFIKKHFSHSALFPLIKKLQRLHPHPNLANRPSGFEIFSPANEQTPGPINELEQADIIHLHWVNNFISDIDFFGQHARSKFVWTLHDMNPLTGGCHHADGCMRFEQDCGVCPQLQGTIDDRYAGKVLGLKESNLAALNNNQLIVVAPSKWLLALSQSSRLLKRFRHVHIDNPAFDASPMPASRLLRSELHLPADKKIVLFVADNLLNPRKGLHLLWDAIRLMPKKDQVQLVGIGGGANPAPDLNIIFTGSIADQGLLQKYYCASDVFVTPSLAENAPLVVIEALTCGTPVVASRVGGIPELVDYTSGLLFTVGDPADLQQQLDDALWNKSFDREVIRAHAQRFKADIVANQYAQVYHDLLHGSQNLKTTR